MASLLTLARRIAAMSPEEIRARATSAIRQRLEALASLRGENPLRAGYSEQAAVVPRFFFDAGNVAMIAAEIRRRIPAECENVIQSARQIRAHQFELLGYGELACGDAEIEWQRDPVHGIVAPNIPWFRVPYLDFRQSGDHKIIWELNRHQHLMLLARAWLYTGDAQFLTALQNIWESWRKSNPYPMGINWASTLEVAFRCLSWIWVDQFTVGADGLPQKFRLALREAIGECAVYTERYLSTYFAPNTHLLGEALALFFAGVLYPGFERARIWREQGWKMILEQSARQVRDDGFHFEQSVYYHVYALDMFIHARILAARNGTAIPESYDQTLRRMAEGLATIGASGKVPRFGDDDGGRLFDGRRNRTEHLLDPLAAAAILYSRGDWKVAAGELHEETIWLLGVEGVRQYDQLAASPNWPRSHAFTASGYYTIASGDGIAVIDAGPHGFGNAGHGHADALSLQLIAGGRDWLTDPGTGAYPQEKPERDMFRSTAAHNTLEVDGRSQAEPVHAFAWRQHPVTRVDRWHEGKRVVFFRGSHDGYTRLNSPVTHERWVIGWQDGFWMVVDRALGEGRHRLDLRWRVAPECVLMPGTAPNCWRITAEKQQMEIIISTDRVSADTDSADPQWSSVCETGSWSPAYGAVISAPVLHFSREGPLPAECVTFLAMGQRGVSSRILPADGASCWLCTVGESRRLIVIARAPGVLWRLDTIESDAELLVIEFSATAIEYVLISGVSQFHVGGEALALENKINGVWESATESGNSAGLSPSTVTALRQVLERLSAWNKI